MSVRSEQQLALIEVAASPRGPGRLPRQRMARPHASPSLLLPFGAPPKRCQEAEPAPEEPGPSAPAPLLARIPSTPSDDEVTFAVFRGHRRTAAAASLLLDAIADAWRGLRRGDCVEVHREGEWLRVEWVDDGLRACWSHPALKVLLPVLNTLAREHGYFPQE